MRGRSRFLLAAPVFVAAITFGFASGAHTLAAVFCLPALAGLVTPRRLALEVPAQVLILMGCGLVAMVWVAVTAPLSGAGSEPLELPYLRLGAAALLWSALRTGQREAFFGDAGTFGGGLLVFLACGTVRTGMVFPAALTLYAALSFSALHMLAAERGERSEGAVASSRQRLAGALLLVLATAFSVSLAVAIPRLYAAAYQWALHYVGDRPVAGFHDGPIALGALHGLLQSEEVVARVEGDAGDHLRGNAYVLYQRGRWLPDRPGDPRRVDTRSAAGPAPEDLRASIRFAKQDLDRFFLPALPGALQLSPARVRVDELGIARAVGDDAPTLVRLLGGRDRAFPVRPPAAGDLALPIEIGVPLMELAASWVSAASTDSERIAALQARLESGFVYTLDAPADLSGDDATRDPLLVFLQETRAGHCEYFASAMTLLARASGVPARLVTGYRIAEWNGFGDYGIVRERHAHAWTEVHLADRGWVAVDPSPLRGSASAEAEATPMWAGLIDYAKVGLDEWGTELLLVVLVVVLAGVQIRRLLVGRADTPSSEAAQVSAVPAYLDALLAALAESGAARRASETLESFAERAEREHRPARSGPDDRAQESARLLRRCAALRYGDQGDDNTLRHDIEHFLTPS